MDYTNEELEIRKKILGLSGFQYSSPSDVVYLLNNGKKLQAFFKYFYEVEAKNFVKSKLNGELKMLPFFRFKKSNSEYVPEYLHIEYHVLIQSIARYIDVNNYGNALQFLDDFKIKKELNEVEKANRLLLTFMLLEQILGVASVVGKSFLNGLFQMKTLKYCTETVFKNNDIVMNLHIVPFRVNRLKKMISVDLVEEIIDISLVEKVEQLAFGNKESAKFYSVNDAISRNYMLSKDNLTLV